MSTITMTAEQTAAIDNYYGADYGITYAALQRQAERAAAETGEVYVEVRNTRGELLFNMTFEENRSAGPCEYDFE